MDAAVLPPAVRVTAFAWSVALDATATSAVVAESRRRHYLESDAHRAVTSALPDRVYAAWQELHEAGISQRRGNLTGSWSAAAAAFLRPPILIRAGSTWRGRSALSEMALRQGRGICVSRLGALDGPDGEPGDARLTRRSRFVQLSPFAEEDFWAVLARDLPPVPALRAPAVAAAGANGNDDGHAPGTANAADLMNRIEASFTASMIADSGTGRSVWAGAWGCLHDALYSIHADASRNAVTVEPVPAGSISHELTHALAGAHEFLAHPPLRAAS